MPDLKGKRVLVTGASQGVGCGIAKAFAAAGAAVIGVARSADKLEKLRSEIEAAGGKFSAVPGDLSTREGVRAIARQCGEADVLINNAAYITTKWESLLDQDYALWDIEFAVNVMAPVTLMKELVPGMIKRGWGRVINISSTAASKPVPLLVAYSASKAALEAASQATAIDFAPHGVRVNVVELGVTDTEALQKIPFLGGGLTVEDLGWMSTPIGRVTKVNEVAALCLFLVSDAADSIAGAIIRVDGGQTAGQFNYRQDKRPQ